MGRARNIATLFPLVAICLVLVVPVELLQAAAKGSDGPAPHTLTGCVRDAHFVLDGPPQGDFAGGPGKYRIVPCTDAPFDFGQYSGKLIRATGRMDLRSRTFICPVNLVILGDCPKGFGMSPPETDYARCNKIDPSKVKTPEDFEIFYSAGPTHADWGGGESLAVTAGGDVTARKGNPGRMSPRETPAASEKTLRISPNQVKKIYAQVLACRFFQLEREYAVRGIMDGGTEFLRVRAGGREHSVSLRNTHVERFSRIVATLKSVSAPAAGTEKENRKTSR